MLDELMILARIKEGDIKAFEGIFRRYYSPLCWYAAGITGDTASAEEIVEELFYVLWKNRERLQVFQSVKSYLYRSVRNEAVQFCEHRGGQGALSGICPYGVRAGLFVRPPRAFGVRGTTDSHPAYARQAAPAPAADFQDAPHGGEEICRDCLVAFVVRQDGGSGNDQGTPNLTK